MGINHRSSTLEQRECIALNDDEVKELLPQIVDGSEITEAVVISTCNRLEIYCVSREETLVSERVALILHRAKGYPLRESYDEFYIYNDEEAVVHLFRVAAGLDSLIIGEVQIAGQIKRAYSMAVNLQCSGIYLNRLFHTAFKLSKRVRNETAINRGAGSVGFAAIELANRIFSGLEGKEVLLVGAGEISQVTAKNLVERSIGALYITNRTFRRAQDLALELGGTPVRLEELKSYLAKVDIVVTATGSRDYLVALDEFKEIGLKRAGRALLILDLAVPRDFEPAIGELEGVTLINVGGLESVVEENMKSRAGEIPAALEIINEEAEGFRQWRCSLRISPTIKKLKEEYELIRERELANYLKRVEGARELTLADELEEFSRQLVGKLIQVPIRKLRRYNSDCKDCAENLPLIEEFLNVGEGCTDEANCCRNKRK